jgi:hypothetical protein
MIHPGDGQHALAVGQNTIEVESPDAEDMAQVDVGVPGRVDRGEGVDLPQPVDHSAQAVAPVLSCRPASAAPR